MYKITIYSNGPYRLMTQMNIHGRFQIIARLKYIQSIKLSAIINDNFDSYFKILVDKFKTMITD